MVSPRCIPDLIASICVGVNGTVFLYVQVSDQAIISDITFVVDCTDMVLYLESCMALLKCCC